MRRASIAALGVACITVAACATAKRGFSAGEGGSGGEGGDGDESSGNPTSGPGSGSGKPASGSSATGTGTGGGQGGQGGSASVCGDSAVADMEGCDDGNTTAGDGCSDACATEAGFTCSGMPSQCMSVCGDGLVVGNEECDDKNMKNGDGCTATCQKELLPTECSNYKTLSEADRNVTYSGSGICDDMMGDQWYRFMGSAGTQMPTAAPPVYMCGTDAPGWMDGTYPLVGDGIVSRTVCFNWSGNPCEWMASIQVLNCNGYYVFKLPNTPVCSLRYCGTM